MNKKEKKLELWQKVFIGLFVGVIIGIIIKTLQPELVDYLKPIGDLFINLLKMIVLPILFFSIISGLTSVSNVESVGRLGRKAALMFVITTACAVIIGLSVGHLLQPGVGSNLKSMLDTTAQVATPQKISILDFFVSIIPTNIFVSFVEDKVLQIVFFAFFTGYTLNLMGEDGKKIANGCNLILKLIFKMVGIVINFAPYGACALIAWLVGKYGWSEMLSLMKFLIAFAVAMIIQFLMFGVFIKIFTNLSPIPFYKKSLEYQSVALSTISSKATLPTTIQVAINKLGISESTASFLLPVAASVNMDGIAIYLSMSAIFFAQAFGITLGLYQYFVLILTTTLGSIGGAGVIGGSMMLMPVVLSSVGIPIEGIAIIYGVDRILDMIRTVINITGDTTVTLIVEAREGNLDVDKYYS